MLAVVVASAVLLSTIVIVGSDSSSVIVTWAVVIVPKVALSGLDITTEKVSPISISESSVKLIVMLSLEFPAGILIVPFAVV